MRSFPSTDLKQMLGDVLDVANREPVTITKHSKPRYVLMSIGEYEERFLKDERKAYSTTDMPAEHLGMLEKAYADRNDEISE